VCLGALLLWVLPASGATFRVLLRIEDEDGLKLAQRIEGQASDLAVEITAIAATKFEPTIDAQLRAADLLAAEHNAQAVVWWDRARPDSTPTGAGWRLYILHLGRGRVLVRSLGQGADQTHADSAILEEAALVVRATLQALLAGAEVGVQRSVVERPAAPPRKPEPSRDAGRDHAASRAAPELASAAGVFAVDAGWQIALDGISAWGQRGPTLSGGRSGAEWLVGLTLAASLGADLESGPVTLRLARHSATGRIALRTPGSQWELAAGAQFGVALFARSTTGTAPGLEPSADRIYWSLLVGPELSASLRPLWPQQSWRIGLVVGADYVPGAAEFGIGTPLQFQRLDSLWLVQPRSSLYVGLEF
jgi:hypothetical protein